ncbi:uncharacterized protein LOC132225542 isoform X2 [Myotis daubentonii]|uniref:uncharacterized protein LOC132225542 isoform X2 n=1 Tax=Myotis daubentonii TaxID=98922 RepID=UPI002873418A|nr:uncharacterized protein LOC132225542 isoform X2 [Myotis daubentonii]
MARGEASLTLRQPHLSRRDLNNLDATKLTPLSKEVISRQATINIGTIGHVAHGKSTVVKSISGVHTVRFKNELERNITIKLGYANAKLLGVCTEGDKQQSIIGWGKIRRGVTIKPTVDDD